MYESITANSQLQTRKLCPAKESNFADLHLQIQVHIYMNLYKTKAQWLVHSATGNLLSTCVSTPLNGTIKIKLMCGRFGPRLWCGQETVPNGTTSATSRSTMYNETVHWVLRARTCWCPSGVCRLSDPHFSNVFDAAYTQWLATVQHAASIYVAARNMSSDMDLFSSAF